MIIVFWILTFFFLGCFAFFVARIIILNRNKIQKRWGRVLTDNLLIEKKSYRISESLTIKGWSYGSTDFIDYEHKMPGVIVIPRRDKKYPYFEHWGAHFALQGYPTICIEIFDKYDKLLTLKAFVDKYRLILRSIKEEFIKDNRIDASKIIYFGVEDSAKVAVLEGLEDESIKVVCGISMPKIEAEEIQKDTSDTDIFLVHCKDDKVVPFEDHEHNKKVLNVGESDFIEYELGGHHILSQEPTTVAFFSIRIKSKLQPIYRQIVKKESS